MLYLIVRVVLRECLKLVKYVVCTRRRALYSAVLFLVFCYWVKDIVGLYVVFVDECEWWVEWGLWWVVLGVLFFIGFGSGMYIGLLFLFSYILKVC